MNILLSLRRLVAAILSLVQFFCLAVFRRVCARQW